MSWSERDEKALSLLKFALDQKGIDPASYHTGKRGDERRINDKLCLLNVGDGKWSVLYTERGIISDLSDHSSLNNAAKDFFMRLTKSKAHWAFRDAWEKETGQTF